MINYLHSLLKTHLLLFWICLASTSGQCLLDKLICSSSLGLFFISLGQIFLEIPNHSSVCYTTMTWATWVFERKAMHPPISTPSPFIIFIDLFHPLGLPAPTLTVSPVSLPSFLTRIMPPPNSKGEVSSSHSYHSSLLGYKIALKMHIQAITCHNLQNILESFFPAYHPFNPHHSSKGFLICLPSLPAGILHFSSWPFK